MLPTKYLLQIIIYVDLSILIYMCVCVCVCVWTGFLHRITHKCWYATKYTTNSNQTSMKLLLDVFTATVRAEVRITRRSWVTHWLVLTLQVISYLPFRTNTSAKRQIYQPMNESRLCRRNSTERVNSIYDIEIISADYSILMPFSPSRHFSFRKIFSLKISLFICLHSL